jgi:hypothetical protein
VRKHLVNLSVLPLVTGIYGHQFGGTPQHTLGMSTEDTVNEIDVIFTALLVGGTALDRKVLIQTLTTPIIAQTAKRVMVIRAH